MSLNTLYVVTGIRQASDLWVTFSTKAPLNMQIQKYVMGGHEAAFSPKWHEPVEAELKIGNLCNEMRGVGSGSLVIASGCITTIKQSQPLPGKPQSYRSSAELRGAYVDVLFDTAVHVGVIIDANDFRHGKTAKKLVSLPKFNLLTSDEDLIEDTVLRALGLPEQLIKSWELLMELAERQR